MIVLDNLISSIVNAANQVLIKRGRVLFLLLLPLPGLILSSRKSSDAWSIC